jgi:hypothetical protein
MIEATALSETLASSVASNSHGCLLGDHLGAYPLRDSLEFVLGLTFDSLNSGVLTAYATAGLAHPPPGAAPRPSAPRIAHGRFRRVRPCSGLRRSPPGPDGPQRMDSESSMVIWSACARRRGPHARRQSARLTHGQLSRIPSVPSWLYVLGLRSYLVPPLTTNSLGPAAQTSLLISACHSCQHHETLCAIVTTGGNLAAPLH